MSEEDLNRLDRYTVEKNKLHNRYLHGHGVVCGLDVVKNPCDAKTVIVKTGYALSPCGEDIIVCKDSAVNVCDLINQCRPASQTECDPMHPGPADTCPKGEQDWVLAICYDEKQSRGTAALRADVMSANSTCGCDGSSASGCGCQPSQFRTGGQQKTSVSSQRKRPQVQCEPTLTCETYKFMVYRIFPDDAPSQDKRMNNLDTQWSRTLITLSERLPSYPAIENFDTLAAWLRDFRSVAWELLSAWRSADPKLKQDIEGIVLPNQKEYEGKFPEFKTAVTNTVQAKILPHLAQGSQSLFCEFLKVSCPDPVQQNCIPLARIHVGVPECQVLSICAVEPREYVLSAIMQQVYSKVRPAGVIILAALSAAVEGLLPILRDRLPVLEGLCCPRATPPQRTRFAAQINRESAQHIREALYQPLSVKKGPMFMAEAFAKPESTVNFETMFLSLIGATDESGKVFATPEEMANPASFFLSHELLRPLASAILPESWSGFLEVISKLNPKDPGVMSRIVEGAPAEGLAGLRETIGELREQLKTQNEKIHTLETRLGTSG